MRNKILILLLVALAPIGALGQSVSGGYIDFLESATLQGPVQGALSKQFTADSLQARIGLAPDDPEVVLEQYLGKEKSTEITLEQSFDFPTVYHHRNRLSKLGIERSRANLSQSRRDLMIEFSDAYLNSIFLSKQCDMMQQQTESLNRLIALNQKAVGSGQKSNMELMQSRMSLSEAKAALSDVQNQLTRSLELVAMLSGGGVDTAQIRMMDYPTLGWSGSQEDFVAMAMDRSPQSEMMRLDSLIAKRTLTLSRNEWIPRLKVGYRADFAPSSTAKHGFVAGISLPLWQNSSKVRYGKALQAATQAGNLQAAARLRISLDGVYTQYLSAQQALSAYQGSGIENYSTMLEAALKGGELNATEYLLLLQNWWQTSTKYLQTEYLQRQSLAAIAILTM